MAFFQNGGSSKYIDNCVRDRPTSVNATFSCGIVCMAAVYPKLQLSFRGDGECKGMIKSTNMNCTLIVCPIEEMD